MLFNMSNATLLFDVAPGIVFLICKNCRFAVLLNRLYSHLSSHHSELTQAERGDIQAEVKSWNGLAADPDTFFLPEVLTTQVKHLPICTDGLQCMRIPIHASIYVAKRQPCSFTCRLMSGITITPHYI